MSDEILIQEIHEKRARCFFNDREIKDLLLRTVAQRSGLDPYTPDKGTRVFLSSDHKDGEGTVYTAEVTIVNTVES